ncbi:MAG TPA: phospho-N-acetylmuramoyl-pentapeptide-transferase [Candidatus Baltobacteraceae bacterium]|nr:phospho-N-acetylmuramoyl-pentapeptide-transferase [Candidatus Baltobacteraceae bacterium]
MAWHRTQSAAGDERHVISFAPMGFWLLFGFVVATIGSLLLLLLRGRLDLRAHAYEDAPHTHQQKTGTPTMGGIAFLAALLATLAAVRPPLLWQLVLLVVLAAAVGAVDDILGIRSGKNRGLRARTKFLATALAGVIFLRAIGESPALVARDVLFHAGSLWLAVPHWLWLVLGILAITGTIHAVNLTDGLDGLAAGTMIPPLVAFAFVGWSLHLPAAWIAACAGAGACLGFLIFNRHPAKLFMGDTGSLALGALLAGTAILTGEMLALIVVGGVFVAEALSVMLQVAYFKATGGKRILRMSPLHHHFELGGWPETKVTLRFWIASVLCSLLGWAIVR